jgi:uncharacterized LabA/DUF88 family protein
MEDPSSSAITGIRALTERNVHPPAGYAAVLIDFENFYSSRRETYEKQGQTYESTQLTIDLRFLNSWAHLRLKGMLLTVVRAYADFGKYLPGWIKNPKTGKQTHKQYLLKAIPDLMGLGIEPVLQPALTSGKNAVDMRIAMDASSWVASSEAAKSLMLVGGDSDYIPVAVRLRSLGTEVVVIGFKGTTASYVKEFASNFYFFEDLLEEDSMKVVQAVKQSQQENVPQSLKYYKTVLEGTEPRLIIVPPEHWVATTEAIHKWMTQGPVTLSDMADFVREDLREKSSDAIASVAPVISQLLASGCIKPIEEGNALSGEESTQQVRLTPEINSAEAMRARTREAIIRTLQYRLQSLDDLRDLQKEEIAKLLFGPTPSQGDINSAEKLIRSAKSEKHD